MYLALWPKLTMKSTWTTTLGLVALLLALSHRGLACGSHGDNNENSREWTREELAELEAKWGFEVRRRETASGS